MSSLQTGKKQSSNSNSSPVEIPVTKEIKISSSQVKIPNQGAFTKIKRHLKEEDMGDPAVTKLLLDQRDELFLEIKELKAYQKKYFQLDKEIAVLRAKILGQKKFEILSQICLNIGGVIFGVAFLFKDNYVKILMIIFGILITFVGFLISFFMKKNESN